MKNSTTRTILQVLGVLLGLYALYFFREIVGYLLISVALSFAGRPIVNLISKVKIKGHSLPSYVGAVLALSCFITLGSVVIGMFGPLVSAEAKALNTLDPHQIAATVNEWMSKADALSSKLNLSDQTPTSFLTDQIKSIIGLSGVGSIFSGIFGFLGSAFIAVFSILFMTFFFLKDGSLFHKMIVTLTPNSQVVRDDFILFPTYEILQRTHYSNHDRYRHGQFGTGNSRIGTRTLVGISCGNI